MHGWRDAISGIDAQSIHGSNSPPPAGTTAILGWQRPGSMALESWISGMPAWCCSSISLCQHIADQSSGPPTLSRCLIERCDLSRSFSTADGCDVIAKTTSAGGADDGSTPVFGSWAFGGAEAGWALGELVGATKCLTAADWPPVGVLDESSWWAGLTSRCLSSSTVLCNMTM